MNDSSESRAESSGIESHADTRSGPRLRFAPSPTGSLHVGGARTALFNWLYAKKYGGEFLLRVEDTDRARSSDESTQAIFDGLEWLGLDWNEEVVFQGANIARHQADALRLLETGAAYRDFTPASELERMRAEAKESGGAFKFDRSTAALSDAEIADKLSRDEPFAIRFRVPEGVTEWEDLVHGRIAFPNKDIEDFIVLRSDRSPVYNLAVVSDDIAMGITTVMRGDDHISNTPKQILLYRALGAPVPEFAHVPMINGPDGKKLSKRHGATAVGDYQHQGLLADAMINFLALLGWSTGDDTEVMTREQLVERFDAAGLQKKAAIFDSAKLEWMNGQHLAMMPLSELAAIVSPLLVSAGVATREELDEREDWFHGLLDLMRVRSRKLDEIVALMRGYFMDDVEYEADAIAKQWKDRDLSLKILVASSEKLSALSEWNIVAMEESLRALALEMEIAPGKIFQPLRVALTGSAVSPGIFEVAYFVGRERALGRIDKAIEYLGRR